MILFILCQSCYRIFGFCFVGKGNLLKRFGFLGKGDFENLIGFELYLEFKGRKNFGFVVENL